MIVVCVSNLKPTEGIQECFASIAVSNTKLEPSKTEKMPKKQPNLMFLKSRVFREKSKNRKKSRENIFFSNCQKMILYDKTKSH